MDDLCDGENVQGTHCTGRLAGKLKDAACNDKKIISCTASMPDKVHVPCCMFYRAIHMPQGECLSSLKFNQSSFIRTQAMAGPNAD